MTGDEVDLGVAEPVQVALPAGRTLVVRSATRDDVDALTALYQELDAEDAYRRFFSAFHPDRDFFEGMATAADHHGDEIVAEVMPADDADRREIVAEAGYRLLPDGDGELSMVITRRWRGWLGAFLLDVLLRRAAADGVANLRADVLVSNRAMVALLCRRGAAHVDDDDLAIVRLLVGTSGPTPTWPADGTRPRLLVEVSGGRWHATAAARRAGFDVLTCSGPRGSPPRCPALRGEVCPLVTGADVVVSRPRSDEAWRALAAAHVTVHPGIPIVVEARGSGDDGIVDALLGLLPPPDRDLPQPGG